MHRLLQYYNFTIFLCGWNQQKMVQLFFLTSDSDSWVTKLALILTKDRECITGPLPKKAQSPTTWAYFNN